MFNNLTEIFDAVEKCEYVVLRNYEEFDDLNFLTSHPDIDFLCANRKELVECLGLKPRVKKDDGIHYYTKVNDTKIAIDLRQTGDGYLDDSWQRNILKNRIKKQNFYVMDGKNYFYSLLYHVVIQKHKIGEDYAIRLKNMADALGTEWDSDKPAAVLNRFMREEGYRYVYPEFAGTVFHKERGDADLIEKNFKKEFARKWYSLTHKVSRKIKK
ncbi:MAG: hypothetical protein MJ119_02745 [Lachnospiraceae bacterium]|nr:hypothetical protein [Lachnospiraceae bacterium]